MDTTATHNQPIQVPPIDLFLGTTISGLVLLFVIALILERALAVLFEWRYYQDYLGNYSLKVPISVGLSLLVCQVYGLDSLSLFLYRPVSPVGIYITAAIISGGSKVVIALAQRLKQGAKEIREEPPKGA